MNIEQMLNDYYKKSLVTKSEGACNFEQKNINGLLKCLKELNIKRTNQLTEDIWYKMISWYQDVLGIKNTTIKKRLSYLRTVLKENRINSIFHQLKYPRSDKTPFLRFQDDDVGLIFETVYKLMDEHPDDHNLKMMSLMLHILLDTGVRNSELFDMKVYNVDLRNKFIYLEHTKNNKKEPVLFSSFSHDLLSDVIASKYHDKYLFYDVVKNQPMTFNTNLRLFLLKLNDLTGLKIHTHRFRKTFGTAMYMQTRDWRFTQRALRHSDIRTTQIYVSESLEFVRESYDTASKAFDKFKRK